MANNAHIHYCRIGTIGINGITYSNLFTHQFYYMQNSITNDATKNCVKALLFLQTLPYSFESVSNDYSKVKSHFNSKLFVSCATNGIENVPYGYLLLLGGLIWRKRYIEDNNGSDPIIYENGDIKYNRPNNLGAPLFIKTNDNKFRFCVGKKNTYNYYNLDIKDLVNVNRLIENKLINIFANFVVNDFQKIMSSCELKLDTEDGIKPINGVWIDYIIARLNDSSNRNNIDNQLKVLNGIWDIRKENVPYSRQVVSNFKDNYVMGFVEGYGAQVVPVNVTLFGGNLIYSFFSETNPIQEIFNDIFYREVLVTNISPAYRDMYGKKGVANKNIYYYLKGYAHAVNHYIESDEQQEPDITTIKELIRNGNKHNNIETNDKARDYKCDIYLIVKNIWDRWLCGYYNKKAKPGELEGRDIFKVKNFYGNFVFIDSFYTDIQNTLKLNCSKLLDQYNGIANVDKYLGMTTVAHLGNVASDHMCVMFNFPDSVNFAEVDENGHNTEVNLQENMKEMFTPMPQNKVTPPNYFNRFTVIYTHSANKLETNDRNKFVPDTFDIFSYDSGTGVAPTVFNSPTKNNAKLLTTGKAMGYKVPAFGIAYSRQDNSLWKNIDVGMDNYNITEQTIRAEAFIAEKGNSEKHNICFYGQDLYSVYQTYSYTVTVEMLGNVQIQPLMYFQLMNVPMFRGTYMIIKVEHNIVQGSMTTVFTGMKMSKVQLPYTQYWFKTSEDKEENKQNRPANDAADNGEPIITIEGDKIDIQDNVLSKAINELIGKEMYCDEFAKQVYSKISDNKVKINKGLIP